jgi:segregation and condensation protein B
VSQDDPIPTTSEGTAPVAPAALAVPTTMKALIEALIFAAEEPLSVKQLKAIYEYSAPPGSGEERKIEADAIRAIVKELNDEYRSAGRPYRIMPIAGGFQFATHKEYADWLGKLRREQGRRKLSQSGVETLAIVAYKQPISKGELESIRGVNCDYVLKTLLEKELVTVTGRAETVGRPLLYGTTRDFLKHFGLNEITDLPRPREIEEILGETQFETERRMLEAQAAAEKAKTDEDFKSRLPHIPKKRADLEQSAVEIVPRISKRELKTRSTTELPFEAPTEVSPAIEPSEEAARIAEPSDQAEAAEAAEHTPAPETSFTRTQTPEPPDLGVKPSPAPGTDATDAHPRNRWKSWKEKISGFIKRLFD